VLRADGGVTANAFLMQFQADLLGVPVEVAAERETTALGAAALGTGAGSRVRVGAVYEPRLDPGEVALLRASWAEALNRSRSSTGSS
jgi:glycerol kinase